MSTATSTSTTKAVRHTDDQDRLHREDGPAIEHATGTREWWLHGLLHREGGPANEYADGRVAHWIRGRRQS